MDFGILVALALAVVLGVPVALIALFIVIAGLKRRISALEAAVARWQDDGRAAPLVQADPESQAPAGKPEAPADADRGPEAVPESVPEPRSAARPPPLPPEVRAGAVRRAAPSRLAELAAWLRANWVYAVSAASLALAGVFFVQYGVEAGLLPGRCSALR